MDVKTLIVYGNGINADQELGNAFLELGSSITKILLQDLIANPSIIHSFHIIGFPGGFSFGDEIRSGKVFSMFVSDDLKNELQKFIQNKKLIIGICNGFQILAQMNLFNNNYSSEKDFVLSTNNHGEFRNFWTEVSILKNNSPWLKNLNQNFFLPVRHKEGRVYGSLKFARPVLKYSSDINGSQDNIAGVVDQTGFIFGLMPHPEAATSDLLAPDNVPTNNSENVRLIFNNAINHIKSEVII